MALWQWIRSHPWMAKYGTYLAFILPFAGVLGVVGLLPDLFDVEFSTTIAVLAVLVALTMFAYPMYLLGEWKKIGAMKTPATYIIVFELCLVLNLITHRFCSWFVAVHAWDGIGAAVFHIVGPGIVLLALGLFGKIMGMDARKEVWVAFFAISILVAGVGVYDATEATGFRHAYSGKFKVQICTQLTTGERNEVHSKNGDELQCAHPVPTELNHCRMHTWTSRKKGTLVKINEDDPDHEQTLKRWTEEDVRIGNVKQCTIGKKNSGGATGSTSSGGGTTSGNDGTIVSAGNRSFSQHFNLGSKVVFGSPINMNVLWLPIVCCLLGVIGALLEREWGNALWKGFLGTVVGTVLIFFGSCATTGYPEAWILGKAPTLSVVSLNPGNEIDVGKVDMTQMSSVFAVGYCGTPSFEDYVFFEYRHHRGRQVMITPVDERDQAINRIEPGHFVVLRSVAGEHPFSLINKGPGKGAFLVGDLAAFKNACPINNQTRVDPHAVEMNRGADVWLKSHGY